MRRGEVYDARLDPTEGSDQAGTRPVVIVGRDAINASSPVVLAVPCTTFRAGRQLYPSHVLLRAPDGGLSVDSVALAEQVRALARSRLVSRRGALSPAGLAELECALRIALDLVSGRV
ncbi:MAG: type II toxin-antitoxin system PemK/MazF family toxin [Chloroflexi bacterium]|nr:type II toxin-antitoxin system PemK/MazF family toxin [Chloroflexota bacterium]